MDLPWRGLCAWGALLVRGDFVIRPATKMCQSRQVPELLFVS